jgi:hypothetical protein
VALSPQANCWRNAVPTFADRGVSRGQRDGYFVRHVAYKVFVFLRSVRRLLVTANVVPSSPILVTLMMEALTSHKTTFFIVAAVKTSNLT